ncbi:hypothetical protein JHD48_06175 [Sulfurimonas sp. SAG-AH-194-I05]|nr:hypothetical protein [Sulfurimonas sp. SAG-AH-194-I05]MDF1875314.1 hypothetical protein [Sulfurimonas sp. SAG-AH-194-I05]
MLKIMTLSFLVINIYAQELEREDNHRERIHSVRDVVSGVLKTEEKELDIVSGFSHMFDDGTVSGQLRSMYSRYNYKDATNTYATALGGHLKYELASYKGFNGGVALTTSQKVSTLSAKGTSFNDELTSSKGNYTQLSEAYVNYTFGDLAIRFGRQEVDTPLADTDDIRMTPNTFEAYLLRYTKDDFLFVGGLLKRFQGFDAGLDTNKAWQTTGDKGTWIAGVTYDTSNIEGDLYYYDVSKSDASNTANGNVANTSIYLSVGGHVHFAQEHSIHLDSQFLQQNEADASGVQSVVYGFLFEYVFEGVGFNLAYNKSNKKQGKRTFSGFGGGTLFTSMDNMILDNITSDRDARGIVGGISYTFRDVNFLYAYGDFDGKADSSGVTQHIEEQDFGIEYMPNEEVTIASIYTKQDDKDQTGINGGSWENFRILVAYSF